MSRLNSYYKNKLANYFLGIGFSVYKNGWFKGTDFECPFCGRVNKFGVNVGTDYFHCFRCDERGHLTDLVKVLEDVHTINEVNNRLDKYKELGYKVKVENEKVDLREKKTLILPEGFRLLNQGNSQLAKSMRARVEKRGFNINQVSRKGWGYATDKKYFGYLIIPYYKDGQIVYFNARSMLSNGPRYLNPDSDKEASIGKSMLFYNEDALQMYKCVFLCEGAINAETLSPDRAICSAGKHLSKYQINLLIKSPIERMIICLDRDALAKAYQLALDLMGHILTKVIVFPPGKDINDIGRAETIKLIQRTRYIRNTQQLNKLKNETL